MNRYKLVNNYMYYIILLKFVAKVCQLISMGISAVQITASMQLEDVASGKYQFGTNLS